MTIEDILAKLVSFAQITGAPNRAMTDWIAERLTEAGARIVRIPGPEAGHENLFASFGPAERPGLILSGHMDVVQAEPGAWQTDPFTLTERDGKLFGRGTSDMLGFVACVIGLAPEFTALSPGRPVHVALSCDEKTGGRGVPSLLARLPDLCVPPLGAIVGEPTRLAPVRGHKGQAAIRIDIGGRPGHSAHPESGLNAIHGLSEVLAETVAMAATLEGGPRSPEFRPPYSTLQAGLISGGRAVNMIPDQASLSVEARAIPGVDPLGLLQSVLARAEKLRARGYDVHHTVLSNFPGLVIGPDAPLVVLAEEASGKMAHDPVSFGTEAGLYAAAGVPAVICGPGDIARTHRPDEYITRDELAAGADFLREALRLAAV